MKNKLQNILAKTRELGCDTHELIFALPAEEQEINDSRKDAEGKNAEHFQSHTKKFIGAGSMPLVSSR